MGPSASRRKPVRYCPAAAIPPFVGNGALGAMVATGAGITLRDPQRLFEVYCRKVPGHRHFQQIADQRHATGASGACC